MLGEFFRENTAGSLVPGELFRGLVGERVCWENCVAYAGTVATYHR